MWKRVSRSSPCPICHKPSWCTYADKVAICMRVSDGSYKTKDISGSPGYYHRQDSNIVREPKKDVELASLDTRHICYSRIENELGLSYYDVAYLEEYRKISPTQAVMLGYRTARQLNNVPFSAGVPGCADRVFYPGDGILLPVRDESGGIASYQILTRANMFGQSYIPKYLWVSTANKPGGCGPDVRAHVSIAQTGASYDWLSCDKELWITEGVLKSDIISLRSGKRVVGLPGINAGWKQAAAAAASAEIVNLAFDMDWKTNPAVKSAISGFVRYLYDYRPLENVFVATWEGHKGLDDLLNAGQSKIEFMPVTRFL